MAVTLYAGPGKFYMSTKVLFPEGENGQITAAVDQGMAELVSGFHGRLGSLQAGTLAKITIPPLDDWSALPLLYPAYLGVSIGATLGALAIGTRPHNPAGAVDIPGKIWTWDGRMYSFPRCAVTKHPDLHLGITKALFGPAEITALFATGKKPGDANGLYSITEAAAADPGGQLVVANQVRGSWIGAWGDQAGFGGDAGDGIEAEDEWVISCMAKYVPLTVQSQIRAFQLASVAFMTKVRPFGPTHTQIDAAIKVNAGRTLGSFIADGTDGKDLLLTGPRAKTITQKHCAPVGAGFDFGGTKLGTGEIGFVSAATVTAGAVDPLLAFSA